MRGAKDGLSGSARVVENSVHCVAGCVCVFKGVEVVYLVGVSVYRCVRGRVVVWG